jgi:parvulin-like peptidyl-prolyl isomerase
VTRTLRLLALSGVAALALTGCGAGPVRTGAAATVGDERITTSTLDSVVTRGLADPAARQSAGADRVAFERDALARLIQHDVVVEAARRQGVTVDGATVDKLQDQLAAQFTSQGSTLAAEAAKAGIAPQDLRQTLTDAALRDALADKLTASIAVPAAALQQAYQSNIAQFDQVDSAHILVASPALAASVLAQVKADPTQFAALAAKYSTDTGSKDKGGELGFQGRGALEKPFENAIFNNKPGSYVIAKTRYGYHVIHVEARHTTTLEQASPTLRRNLLSQQRTAALGAYLLKVSKDLGVHVNPRFGRWDASAQQVVAIPDCPGASVSSPSPRPGAQAPAADPSAAPVCP